MLIPSGRVMLSANLIADANAHHRIRHRARHGLRGGVASPLQRFAPVDPRRRPRRPRQRPRQQSCHGLCFIPRRSRAFDAAHAPRQRLTQACAPGHPDKSGFRGVEHPASQAGTLDFFLSSTGSPLALSDNSNLPAQWAVDQRRRMAALGNARAREKTRCPRCRADLALSTIPAHHPTDPASIPSESSSGTQKNPLRMMAPSGGQMPPRQPCRRDRDALRLLQARRPVCRVSMSPLSDRAHPPSLGTCLRQAFSVAAATTLVLVAVSGSETRTKQANIQHSTVIGMVQRGVCVSVSPLRATTTPTHPRPFAWSGPCPLRVHAAPPCALRPPLQRRPKARGILPFRPCQE